MVTLVIKSRKGKRPHQKIKEQNKTKKKKKKKEGVSSQKTVKKDHQSDQRGIE